MRWFEAIIIGALLCLLVFGGLNMISYLPIGNASYAKYEGNTTLMPAVGAVQFYPNMRYVSSNINYSVESACSAEKTINILRALDIISSKTVLTFQKVDSGGQIVYLCSLPAPSTEQQGHFVAGEGGPTSIINTTAFSLILSGQVALYRNERCSTPNIAIHETLHALGFDHVNDPTDIMYPVTDCNKEIKPTMIAAINKLYSYPTEPDLGIDSLSANRTGRYLNFHIAVSNHGLSDAIKTKLTLTSNAREIKSFDLGAINVGTRKFLDVQNLIIPSNADKIIFTVKLQDGQSDLFPADDDAEITLS